jgi:mycothiol synthase
VQAELELRPPGPADSSEIAALLNEHARRLFGESELTAAEVEHWFAMPHLWMRVASLDGRVVGYLDVADEGGAGTHFDVDLRTLDGGVAAALLAAAEERVRAAGSPGALARGWAAAGDAPLAGAYEAAGFRVVRHSFQLRIDLDGPPPGPAWPDGIAVRTFRPEDEEAVHEAHMESFADHWDFRRTEREEWRHWGLDRPGFDPTLWFLAVAGDELAGLSLCQWHYSGEPDFGWVNVLGVRPAWRRRGLGRALLLHSFAELGRRGATRVGLGVDAESTTGALELYEQAGMRAVRRLDTWERAL